MIASPQDFLVRKKSKDVTILLQIKLFLRKICGTNVLLNKRAFKNSNRFD